MTNTEYSQAYEAGFPVTIRFLISRGAAPDTAEETAQAAWSRGWERVHQLRNGEVVRSWVNAIALNLYRRVAGGERRRQPLTDHIGTQSINFAAIELGRIMNTCHPAHQLLLQHQLQGLSIREIAKKDGASELAVRLRMMRARRAARSAGCAKTVRTSSLT